MKGGGTDAMARDLVTLFSVGTRGGLSDGQLLGHFVERREADAFAVLMHRHGPMVWGVCRRVLRDGHDAEDAFQATFLVLTRKAASVLPREKLGNWLYGVAYRTATKAKAMRDRRRSREGKVSDPPEPMAATDDSRAALTEDLDRELSRLPEKYRIPIVFCELEGKSHAEAARQLGWPVGTVSSRLSRGKSLLAKRLSRSGVVVASGSLAVHLTQGAASAGMPTRLVLPTAHAASLFAAGSAFSGESVSADVVALTTEVLKSMLLSKLKVVAMVVAVALTAVSFWKADAQQVEPRQVEPRQARKDDLARLQGTWKAVKVSSSKAAPSMVWEFKGTTVTVTETIAVRTTIGVTIPASVTYSTPFALRPEKSPKHFNMLKEDKFFVLQLALYEVDDDRLRVCFADPTETTPLELRAYDSLEFPLLIEFRREKSVEEKAHGK